MDAGLSLLASGDVDALRLHLKHMTRVPPAAGALGPSSSSSAKDDAPADPATEALATKGILIADDILKRGLPHLERAAAAEAAAQQRLEAERTSAQPATVHVAELGLTLREHSVMGQVVWPAAFALAQWLQARPETCRAARVVELGAGAGAPGLVASKAGAAFLLATDGDESLVPLMAANCAANAGAGGGRGARDGGAWEAARLDWREADALAPHAASFDLVLAADVLYAAGDIQPLAHAAAALLRPAASTAHGRFVLACSAWFGDLEPTLLASAAGAGLRLASREEMARRGAAEGEQRPVVLEFVLEEE